MFLCWQVRFYSSACAQRAICFGQQKHNRPQVVTLLLSCTQDSDSLFVASSDADAGRRNKLAVSSYSGEGFFFFRTRIRQGALPIYFGWEPATSVFIQPGDCLFGDLILLSHTGEGMYVDNWSPLRSAQWWGASRKHNRKYLTKVRLPVVGLCSYNPCSGAGMQLFRLRIISRLQSSVPALFLGETWAGD